MKKEFIEYSDLAKWAISNLVDDKIEEILNNSDNDKHEVYITINGIEVDFEEILISINSNFNHKVKKKLRSFLSDVTLHRVRGINDALYDLEQRIEKIDLSGLIEESKPCEL